MHMQIPASWLPRTSASRGRVTAEYCSTDGRRCPWRSTTLNRCVPMNLNRLLPRTLVLTEVTN
jgi:hypothetical protein